MFYNLLDVLVCADCRGPLALLVAREEAQTTAMRMAPARRASPPGAVVGPMGGRADSPLARILAPLAAAPAQDGRERRVAVSDGILVCPACARWFPIRRGLPEVLPDHLRDWQDDRAWLAARRADAGPALNGVWPLLEERRPQTENPADRGAHHKRAEMSVTQRPLPKDFFRWADVAPFSASSPLFSLDLLARYVTTVSRLGCGVNGVVFDLGAGTGWTTEWLVRLGYQAIGVDICRDYILAGMPRRGEHQPHFVIGDVEHIPLRDQCIDAVLSFDAFHHIPDRPRAMAEFARIMRPGTAMVLTEPGIEHEHAAVSIDVMREHGILERGFDRAGLEGYISGLPLGNVQHYRSDTHPHDLYSLHKEGTFETDSLAPRALVAGITPEPARQALRAGDPIELIVTIANRGDTRWLAATPGETGEVHLGAQLYDASHALLRENYARVKLPRDMRPGDTVRLRCALPPIRRPGSYLIELDMIDTDYLWFKAYAYQPVAWPVSIAAVSGMADDEPLVSDWPPRIVPEDLPLPPPPPTVPVNMPAPAARRPLMRRVLDVWRSEGAGAIARRVAARLSRSRATDGAE
jgi:uncharacterized protein YbaR (Trm112 family)/SAM-dependent methyltransferase